MPLARLAAFAPARTEREHKTNRQDSFPPAFRLKVQDSRFEQVIQGNHADQFP